MKAIPNKLSDKDRMIQLAQVAEDQSKSLAKKSGKIKSLEKRVLKESIDCKRFRAVCDEMQSAGKGFKASAKALGHKQPTRIWRHYSRCHECREYYDKSVEIQSTYYAEEIIEIADKPAESMVEVNRHKLQIDSRFKLLKVRQPEKYNDRLIAQKVTANQINANGNVFINMPVIPGNQPLKTCGDEGVPPHIEAPREYINTPLALDPKTEKNGLEVEVSNIEGGANGV